jgi:hypothetical protein
MWTDLFMKAPNEAAFIAALPADLKDAETPITFTSHTAMDVVGILYTNGTYSPEGAVLALPVAIPGWHVNMRVRAGFVLPAELLAFVMPVPNFPKRIFSA